MRLERGRRQSLQGLVEQRWASVFNLEKWGDTDGLNWAGWGGWYERLDLHFKKILGSAVQEMDGRGRSGSQESRRRLL